MHQETDGLVLRETRYKDADKILTLLTRDHGKLTVSARGALKPKYKNAASTQVLAYSRFQLFNYKDRWQLQDASLYDAWLPLRTDLDRVSLGYYAAELCEAVAQEGVAAPELLTLLGLMLHRLGARADDINAVKAAYELRLMALSGYEPDVRDCVVCGTGNPLQPRLHALEGALHCADCRAKMPEGLSLPLSADSLAALRYVLQADVRKLFSFELRAEDARLLARTAEVFTLTQLERGFNTLEFYKRIRGDS